MFTWDWIYKEFIQQKIMNSEEFSYEEFADLFVEPDRSMVDMYYIKALDYLTSDANLKHYWTPNETKAKLLLAIKDCNASYRALRVAIRTSAIFPESFDAYIHHNILTVEAIITNFLDTLEFYRSFIMNENYERICASSVVIPTVRQLFKINVALSTKWYKIQS
ncbi:hypothetical protein CU097_004281 [Rhizopus azygosporus]|uniref:Uncharacterized protein n=1 Tax=Rhizopus azygosporus TaxID=86630 RepID=A0A367JCM6_RHIAZ|nr:hypothetical protein CU097_004281 [Rhizopus azygosporus]